MTTEKIAPCPWCGKEPSDPIELPNTYYFVACSSPNTLHHYVYGPVRKTRAGAIKAWNERRPK